MLGTMALTKKNSSFNVLNDIFNVPVTLLFYRGLSLTCPARMKLCTRSPHLEVVKNFGLPKRKPGIPIRADDETHHPDTVNFSHPCLAHRTTKSHASPLLTIVVGSSPSMLEVPPPPIPNHDFCLVNYVQQSKVDEKVRHIAGISYNSSKACWAMHAVTKKKCTAKIVSNRKSTPPAAYLGVWNFYKYTTLNLKWTINLGKSTILK